MTSKERMLTAMAGGIPDSVPVAPDTSNMIPCRLTGKPFWDVYLYQDPPLWEAYIDTVKYFGFDGWLPSVPVEFLFEETELEPRKQEAIVRRTRDRIYTRFYTEDGGKRKWTGYCNVYYAADPPTRNLELGKVGLSDFTPTEWEDVQPVRQWAGAEAYHAARELMGDRGVVGVSVGLPGLYVRNPEEIYEYYDDRKKTLTRCEKRGEILVRRARGILDLKPDFVLIGISGHMISNPEPIFRDLSLDTLKAITSLAEKEGILTQIHCCGPENDLVRISAEETDLTSINPLEIPPMGDCILADIKKKYGNELSLMGNLHTTDVMLRGTAGDVEEASKKAIDDAAEGGGFILSTGDQCGRDTPDENIHAMINTARQYGSY